MENKPSSPPAASALGPRPAEAAPTLSPSRAAVLEALRHEEEPVTLLALATATGLHPNTVREHLDALLADGLARRERALPHGRGRPAWRYEARDGSTGRLGAEHAGLAAALASFLSRTSAAPRADATAAGTEWGRDLARARGAAATCDDEARRRRVVQLLDDLGFAPTADDRHRVVRLTRCPLLETARTYPEVVCGVHLGVVRGALAEYGAQPGELDAVDLVPFAEPGACLLDLVHAHEEGHR